MLSQEDTTQADGSPDCCSNDNDLTDSQDDFQTAAVAAYFDYLYTLTSKPKPKKTLRLKNICKKRKHLGRKSEDNTDLSLVSEPSVLITTSEGQQKTNNGLFRANSQALVTGMQMEVSVDDVNANVTVSTYTSEAVAGVNTQKQVTVRTDTSNQVAAFNTTKPSTARNDTSSPVAALYIPKSVPYRKDTSNSVGALNIPKPVTAKKDTPKPVTAKKDTPKPVSPERDTSDPHPVVNSKSVPAALTSDTPVCSNTAEAVDAAARSSQWSCINNKTDSSPNSYRTRPVQVSVSGDSCGSVDDAARSTQRSCINNKTVSSLKSYRTRPVHVSVSGNSCGSVVDDAARSSQRSCINNKTVSSPNSYRTRPVHVSVSGDSCESVDDAAHSAQRSCINNKTVSSPNSYRTRPVQVSVSGDSCGSVDAAARSSQRSCINNKTVSSPNSYRTRPVHVSVSGDSCESVDAAAHSSQRSCINNKTVSSPNSYRTRPVQVSVSGDSCGSVDSRNLTIKDVTMSPRTKKHNEILVAQMFNRLYDTLIDEEGSETTDICFHDIYNQSFDGRQVVKKLKKPRRKLRKLRNCLSASFRMSSCGSSSVCDTSEGGSADVSVNVEDRMMSDAASVCLQDTCEDNTRVIELSAKEDKGLSVRSHLEQHNSNKQHFNKKVGKSKEEISNKIPVREECENAAVYNVQLAEVMIEQTLNVQAVNSDNSCNNQNSEREKLTESESVLSCSSKDIQCQVLSSEGQRKCNLSVVPEDKADYSNVDNSVVSDSRGDDSVGSNSKGENLLLPDIKGSNQVLDSKEENGIKGFDDSWLDDDGGSTCSGVAGSSDTETFDVSRHINSVTKLRSGAVVNSKCQQYYKLVSELSNQSEKNTMVNTEEGSKVQRCVKFKRKRLDWSDRRSSKRRRHLQTKHGESRDTSYYKVKTHKTDLIRNSLKFGCKRSDVWRKTKHKTVGRQKNFENIPKKRFKNVSKNETKENSEISRLVKNCKEAKKCAKISTNRKSKAKDASSKRLGPKKREKICKEQSVLKSHEAIGTSHIPTDPFTHLCRLECQAVDIGVAAMETLLSNKQPIGRNSNNPTVVFSGRHKHAQWHPGGIWQAIVTEK